MPQSGTTRRSFLKTALVVGGSSALAACIDREGAVGVPQGRPDSVPERQFAWNEALPTGPHGNVKLPNHQLLLFLTYAGDGAPTAEDRDRVRAAFGTLERAYQWGTGFEYDTQSTRGLLFLVGYAPRYFDRFDVNLPAEVAPNPPADLIADLGEGAEPDAADAVVVLSSDEVQVLLAAEQALRGTFDTLNGTSVAGGLTSAFDIVDRRTGFLGVGRPARALDADIPEKSPTAMGYRSGFKDNQATEDRVSIGGGPFTDGTTMQVSRLAFDLESWYELDEEARIHRMFSPEHSRRDVGEIGERLGGQSRISRETVDRAVEDAETHGVVGHTQKVAGARDSSFEPELLRRSEGVSTDLSRPGMNFISLQRFVDTFVEVRRSMDCPAHDHERDSTHGVEDTTETACPVANSGVDDSDNGILGFMETLTRGTYLVPPRTHRALPGPRPG
jgi:hypothetical protein